MKRFWDKVDKRGGIHPVLRSHCWVWIASVRKDGYGEFRYGGRAEVAHRVSYTLEHGAIPDGLDTDHLCRNRSCVRPSHLQAVTHKVNVQRGINVNRLKTHCPHGHEYSDANTYRYGHAGRKCRECALRYKRNKTRTKCSL